MWIFQGHKTAKNKALNIELTNILQNQAKNLYNK